MDTAYKKTLELDKVLARAVQLCACRETKEMMRALASTTAVGSTKTVAPEEETSWMTPPTSPRYSARTGTT